MVGPLEHHFGTQISFRAAEEFVSGNLLQIEALGQAEAQSASGSKDNFLGGRLGRVCASGAIRPPPVFTRTPFGEETGCINCKLFSVDAKA